MARRLAQISVKSSLKDYQGEGNNFDESELTRAAPVPPTAITPSLEDDFALSAVLRQGLKPKKVDHLQMGETDTVMPDDDYVVFADEIDGDEAIPVLDDSDRNRFVSPSGAEDYAENVLNAWIAVETITPIKSSSLMTIIDGRTGASLMPILDQGKLPWEDGYPHDYDAQTSGYNGYKLYDVVLGHIDLAQAEARFVKKFGDDDDADKRFTSGIALLATVRITKDGYVSNKTIPGLDISSFGWGMVRSLSGGLNELPKWLKENKKISDMFYRKFESYHEINEKEEEPREIFPVTTSVLQDMYYTILDAIGAGPDIVSRPAHKDDLIKRPSVAVGHWFEMVKEYKSKSGVVKQSTPNNDEADPIITNSFFLNDLIVASETLERKPNEFPPLLKRYLGIIKPSEQINILKNKSHLEKLLKPENFPFGKWPVLGRHSLVSMQQAVVNYAASKPDKEDEVYGKFVVVNGPPGTGKTTSFKDFVASQIVKRARAMIDVQRSGRVFHYDKSVDAHVINKALRGFEMVVASSNNGAVENVSSEWPAKSAIAEDSGLSYFTGLAQVMHGDDSWGTVSAVLGNKSNRLRFYRSVWMNPDRGLQNQLMYASGEKLKPRESDTKDKGKDKDKDEDNRPFEFIALEKTPNGKKEALVQWAAAEKKFMDLYVKVENAMKAASSRVVGEKLPFNSHDEFQKLSPWLNAKENRLREDLFEAAFEVHKAFIYVNAAQFKTHFSTAMSATRKKGIASQTSLTVLSIAFPVVSTTFASFSRMFSGLADNSIGWLLIDEAGQATPQAAVGALSRAKNVMIVGDPLQVPPVVTLNENLIKAIYTSCGVDKSMMAPEASVQTIADAASEYCAEYSLNQHDKRKVGIPFLVHRRCAEPMFSISNHTAYGGMMVHATQKRESKIREAAKHSRWISVADDSSSNKWCIKEGEVAMKILRLIVQAGGLQDFYVVTPFRDVEHYMRSAIGGNREWLGLSADEAKIAQSRVGTIHKVQGREADTVIMLLGAQGTRHHRARLWAGGIPNLLNVAASRAKSNLYVVGNRAEWRDCGYFRALDHYIDIEQAQDMKPSV